MGEAELNEDGTSKVTINNLEPNTVYPEGTFRVAHVKNEKVSDYVDVPEFKTKPTTTNKDEQDSNYYCVFLFEEKELIQ